MKKNKKLLIGAMALSLVLSTGAAAYAATDQRDAVRQARIDSMEEAAAELVENGTITQETADKLTEFKENRAAAKNGIGTLTEEQRTALWDAEAAALKSGIAELVDDGTITQEQADQMIQGRKMMPAPLLTDDQRASLTDEVKSIFESKLADLVDDGTITQEQADELQNGPGAMGMGPGGPGGRGGRGPCPAAE
jgi:polyhydroxyalkanoate synthesis regulator phasin